MAFKIGDVVMLKSGGPDMTVEDPKSYNDQVECQWFGGRKLERGRFPPGSLVYAPTEGDAKK